MEIHPIIQAAVDTIPEGQFAVITDEGNPGLIEVVSQIRDPVWRPSVH